jgi:diguanylate cyclase (GGDEF)-like protein/PAS domain S-box-containing protein
MSRTPPSRASPHDDADARSVSAEHARLSPAEVQARLSEAEETLRAIRNGEVDALVVRDSAPLAQVFTLSSADRPYRLFVENMRDGAATVSDAGTILYANHRLAELVSRPLKQIIGSSVASLLVSGDGRELQMLSRSNRATIELELIGSTGVKIPVRVNTSRLDVESHSLLCFTFADLTEQNSQKLEIERLGQAQAERMRELEAAQTALVEQATHDALTGLPNRNLLIDRLAQALAFAERSGRRTGLIFVDLDHFKAINDTGGHAAGDSALRQIAQRLLSAVRPMDSVSRLGGDEFVVLLPALDRSTDAMKIAARIQRTVDSPLDLDHGAVPVTASIGVSICDPAAPGKLTPDSLLRRADSAMYHAKSLGGARTELFDEASTPTVEAADRELWITRIRRALDNDRFELHAQPIIELATGDVVQHELLLRMRDDRHELIPPVAFLPTAERCGLIAEIDRWVISEAIQLAGRGNVVAVNLSAASAGDPRVLALIERQLRRHVAEPGKVVFEITETAVMQDMDRATRFVERLVALGCRLSLDDFGTGFASFTYLKRLPVQFLKIDIDFVRDVARSQRDMFVVRAIVALANDFGQQTIAEGVEDEETAEVLRELGVTYAQGYLFGRPETITDSTWDTQATAIEHAPDERLVGQRRNGSNNRPDLALHQLD